MKICFLTDDPSLLGGGPEHIHQVSRLLKDKYGCLVDIVTPQSMDAKFNVHSFWQRTRFTFWTLKFLLTSDYDIYHSHTFSTHSFLPLVSLRGKRAGITVHGQGVNLIGGGILNKTGISKFLMWLVLRVWPYDFHFSAGRLKGYVFIGNGVGISEFDQEKSKPDSRYFTVLCVSRRDPVKGVEILEKAIKIVQKKYLNIRLNLISGRQRMVRDFKTADLYVLPSLSEGLPIVLLEAMAAKLPIIATDVGDCRSLVEKAQSGYIVRPGDIKELSGAIFRVIRLDKTLQKKMGENGYNFVKVNYPWEKVAQKVYETYKQVLKK